MIDIIDPLSKGMCQKPNRMKFVRISALLSIVSYVPQEILSGIPLEIPPRILQEIPPRILQGISPEITQKKSTNTTPDIP